MIDSSWKAYAHKCHKKFTVQNTTPCAEEWKTIYIQYIEEAVVETYQTKKGAKARKQRIKEQATSKPKKKRRT